MAKILAWIFTLSLLIGGIVFFYYAVYYFFGTIGVFIFITFASLWLVSIKIQK